MKATNPTTAAATFPVVLLSGVSHMQFASGTPPALVKARDLKPLVTYEQAHAMIAKTTVAFLKLHLGGDSSGLPFLQQQLAATGTFSGPLITAYLAEGSTHYKPVCYKQTPGCVDGCPYTPTPNCSVNATWVATAQQALGGFSAQAVRLDVEDEFRPVWQATPDLVPSVSGSCSSPTSPGCALTVHTYNDITLNLLSALDTGFYPTSAVEIRAKLVSRQALQAAAGVPNPNFNATDGPDANLCGAANALALKYAQQHSDPATVARFASVGQPYVIGDDVATHTGPTWLASNLKYDNSSATHVTVVSSSLATSLEYFDKSLRGLHYCMLLSPARAMEWMYVDGLRLHAGIHS